MKTKKLISLGLIFIATGLQAQTYIQGKSVIPFHEMAESELIRQSKRLPSEDALRLYNERIFPKGRKDRAEELPGEWWLIEDLLIQIVARKQPHSPIRLRDLPENSRYFGFEMPGKNYFGE